MRSAKFETRSHSAKHTGGIRPAVVLLLAITTCVVSRDCAGQIFGANYNERPRDAAPDLFAASHTSWVRGFFDMFQLEGVNNLANNNNVVGMRRAADAGQQLLVSFKWNFDGNNEFIPSPGSPAELAWFDLAVDTLEAIGRPVNTIVLGNEPMWETENADLQFTSGASPYVPYVRFAERLRDHLHAEYGSSLGTPPRYFVGALNRLDQTVNRTKDVVQELLRVARENPGIDGLDLHVHFDTLAQAESMIQYGRRQLGPDKDLLVTEFSPVWHYKAHLDDAIGATSAGTQFAQQYGYSPSLQVDEYLTNAFAHQVSRQEWGDFVISQPWFNENHISDMGSLFQQYDVSIATLGFAHSLNMRGFDATRSGWNPYQINWLYIIGLVEGPALLDAYNEPYMEDWLAAQYSLADLNANGNIDADDYWRLVEHTSLDVTATSFTDALALGDLNLDRRIDGSDLDRFAALYEGYHGMPFFGPADIDLNGAIDGHDWAILLSNLVVNLAEANVDPSLWRGMGDIDESGVVDRTDFRLFKSAFAAAHGVEGLQALLSSAPLPEPSTCGLAGVLFLIMTLHVRKRST